VPKTLCMTGFDVLKRFYKHRDIRYLLNGKIDSSHLFERFKARLHNICNIPCIYTLYSAKRYCKPKAFISLQ